MLRASPGFIFVGALDLYGALPTVSEEQQPLCHPTSYTKGAASGLMKGGRSGKGCKEGACGSAEMRAGKPGADTCGRHHYTFPIGAVWEGEEVLSYPARC